MLGCTPGLSRTCSLRRIEASDSEPQRQLDARQDVQLCAGSQ